MISANAYDSYDEVGESSKEPVSAEQDEAANDRLMLRQREFVKTSEILYE